ncbi:type II toxin-antitoxin system RelE/ParE family toxin [Scytonema sp. NUACC26]|uniref:type II toxin-antitoxin system RelE/ParE family toxin n=1 Tax=Scytonema sp. NUACC26 TaxID=3140176 RepID=UPI0034DC02D2
MTWNVEYTNEFGDWWETLEEDMQDSISAVVNLLAEKGTALGFPYSSSIADSRQKHMRELRIQHRGNPVRVFYAFDPRRSAILLIGGDKTGNDRFYEEYIPIANRLYDEYIEELKKEGKL